jgi:hypothetical protein
MPKKGPPALTFLVAKFRNGYIGFGAKIVCFAKEPVMLRAHKEVEGSSSPGGYIFCGDQISCAQLRLVERRQCVDIPRLPAPADARVGSRRPRSRHHANRAISLQEIQARAGDGLPVVAGRNPINRRRRQGSRAPDARRNSASDPSLANLWNLSFGTSVYPTERVPETSRLFLVIQEHQ